MKLLLLWVQPVNTWVAPRAREFSEITWSSIKTSGIRCELVLWAEDNADYVINKGRETWLQRNPLLSKSLSKHAAQNRSACAAVTVLPITFQSSSRWNIIKTPLPTQLHQIKRFCQPEKFVCLQPEMQITARLANPCMAALSFTQWWLCCALFVFPGSAGSQALCVKAKGDALLKNKVLLEWSWAALHDSLKTRTQEELVQISMCKTTLES